MLQDLSLIRGMPIFGPSMIAVLVAIPLVSIAGPHLMRYPAPGEGISFFTVAVGVIGRIILSPLRRENSPETIVLSTLVGGASVMLVPARELGGDFWYITLSYCFLLLVMLTSLSHLTHVFARYGTCIDAKVNGSLGVFGPEKFGTIAAILFLAVPAVIVLASDRIVCMSVELPEDLNVPPPQPFEIYASMASA
ncbi:hypothetical protein CONLIGDRAFT_687870 [Coniochaeta ligniaria NRRL 30616]|uniref:Uncharacterized protein n=1 Tax=Coniochaeta ligniaria NRRL 30616 TaxID=1408157 RepID=A0A1J7J3K8_9PEZI|nr:hypothetical protein CONLIGDRAFT_687870 [Coniochaeta ligniaria NRRL 30616]